MQGVALHSFAPFIVVIIIMATDSAAINANTNAKSNFIIVKKINTDFGIIITKFRSTKTGLTVTHADVQAPVVNGFFALATETTDDYGCPHTLEHLVFLGSHKYPYKGVLDALANRALAQGTNAWTDTDHTCYTVTTAGSQGFLNILPIYIDHILYPTLTYSGYYTEVHHINGKGEDAGVVYSEMQGRQNSSFDRIQRRMQRLMFPPGCGYRSETGGLMEYIRELKVEQIREYHASYYRPDNLCLIITGKVDHTGLLNSLMVVEESILSRGSIPPMKRPWVDSPSIPRLQKSTEEILEFPDEDESMGEAMLAWMAPKIDEFLELKVIEVLNTYLTDSPVSVLQREFVEIEVPLCTDIDFSTTDQLISILTCNFSNVPTEQMHEVKGKFFAVLRSEVKNGLDMGRMATIIEREKLKLLNNIENSPHMAFAITCITDFLYGKPDGMDLEMAFKDLDYLDIVSKFSSDDWVRYLNNYYIEQPHIFLAAKPSAEFAKKLLEEETQRTERQRQMLGEKNLKKLEEKLEQAKRENEVPLPTKLTEAFPIPEVSTIQFIPVVTARNPTDLSIKNEVQDHVNADKTNTQLFIQYDHIQSTFLRISVYVITTALPSYLRPYMNMFLESFFALPVKKENGEILPYEEVVRLLSEDTVEYYSTFGLNGNFREVVGFGVKVEATKAQKAIDWLQDLLWNSEFSHERLKITASKMLNDIPQSKREGRRMANATLRALIFDQDTSTLAANNVLLQAKFLQKLVEQLEEEPETIVKNLEELRYILCRPENFRIHVSGDILKLERPKGIFRSFGQGRNSFGKLTPIPYAQQVLTPKGVSPGYLAKIVSLPSIESTFALHCAPGPKSFLDSDVSPLMVVMEILETMEGVFWKLIRGAGLAYGANIWADPEAGVVYFSIFRSPDASKAFEQARIIVGELADKKVKFDKAQLDGAKSGVIFSIVEREETAGRAATQSFLNQVLKMVPASHHRDLLAEVQAVTLEDAHRVLKKYLQGLFQPESSNVVVISAPGKVHDVQAGYEKSGYKMDVVTLEDVITL